MTDHDFEKKWNEMIDEQAPQLWNRIEMRLNALEQEEQIKAAQESPAQQEPQQPGFFKKLKQFMFGGGSLRTAASLTCIAIVCVAVGGGLFRPMGMGSSGTAFYSAAKSAAEYDSAPLTGAAGSYDRMEAAEEAAIEDNGYDAEMKAETPAVQNVSGSTAQASEGESSRKLIRNISIDAETTEFDDLIETVKAQTSQAGGYIESSNISGNSYTGSYNRLRNAYMTLRIPTGKTDAFLETLSGEVNIISRSEDLKDVTLQYVDMESHMKALRAEEEQLLKLMEKAETTDDLILIQSELTDVRYRIESYQSQLNTYDNLIDYDTINLVIDEVKQESPTSEPTVLQRIRNGLANNTVSVVTGIGEFIIWMITMIPVFVVLFVVILAIVSLIRMLGRRRRNRKNRKA